MYFTLKMSDVRCVRLSRSIPFWPCFFSLAEKRNWIYHIRRCPTEDRIQNSRSFSFTLLVMHTQSSDQSNLKLTRLESLLKLAIKETTRKTKRGQRQQYTLWRAVHISPQTSLSQLLWPEALACNLSLVSGVRLLYVQAARACLSGHSELQEPVAISSALCQSPPDLTSEPFARQVTWSAPWVAFPIGRKYWQIPHYCCYSSDHRMQTGRRGWCD